MSMFSFIHLVSRHWASTVHQGSKKAGLFPSRTSASVEEDRSISQSFQCCRPELWGSKLTGSRTQKGDIQTRMGVGGAGHRWRKTPQKKPIFFCLLCIFNFYSAVLVSAIQKCKAALPLCDGPHSMESASLWIWINLLLTYHYVSHWILFAMRHEKEMATHSSTLAWKIPWTEEPGRLQSMGSRRVGHDWATSVSVSVWRTWASLVP